MCEYKPSLTNTEIFHVSVLLITTGANNFDVKLYHFLRFSTPVSFIYYFTEGF